MHSGMQGIPVDREAATRRLPELPDNSGNGSFRGNWSKNKTGIT